MTLNTSHVSTARLDRCVLDLSCAMLVVRIMAGLVAMRTDRSRLEQVVNSTHTSLAGDRWFGHVPAREPLPQTASPGLTTARTFPPTNQQPAGIRTDAELEAQQPRRTLCAGAQAATMRAALETWSAMARSANPPRFAVGTSYGDPPAAVIVPAAASAGLQDIARSMSPAWRSTPPRSDGLEVLLLPGHAPMTGPRLGKDDPRGVPHDLDRARSFCGAHRSTTGSAISKSGRPRPMPRASRRGPHGVGSGLGNGGSGPRTEEGL
jgi:hypothetical protein